MCLNSVTTEEDKLQGPNGQLSWHLGADWHLHTEVCGTTARGDVLRGAENETRCSMMLFVRKESEQERTYVRA